MLCGVNGFAGAASVCLCQVNCSQTIVGGVRSWVTIYHVDRWASEIHAVWRLVHRRFQLTSGYLRTTRIKSPISVLLCMALRTPYIRLLSLHMVSFLRGDDKYAMSRAYWRTWMSLLRILLICWGFSTASVMFHFRKKAAVPETFCAANVHILPWRNARQFRAMSGKAHPPSSFGRWTVVVGTRKVAPFHINHVQINVSCWM